MRLALVCGSVREESQTKKLMRQIQSRFADKDIELDFIDFRESPLPIFDGSMKQKMVAHTFIERINAADALILASPEYHNSFSGALKNAFDFITNEQLMDKPIGLIATAGGGKGGINCLNGMRIFLRGLYALVLADQVVLDGSDFDKDGICRDEAVMKRVDDLVNKVIHFSNMLQATNI
ncbi:NADPH-dependent FMN reductase [Bacillus mycoides]|uniref:NADPH-dependent FMN reductase n=1 Tax=Bacillus TaxID=1386 RepID=UPI001912C90A|nr:NADPH-dependent FMN reductase [Bacillus sp. TH25]MBK5432166.1 NAD(P)H-dependent oxidoreductase [Bacillus sp. TH25]